MYSKHSKPLGSEATLEKVFNNPKRGFHQWHKHNVSVAWQQAQQQQQQKKCTRNRKN